MTCQLLFSPMNGAWINPLWEQMTTMPCPTNSLPASSVCFFSSAATLSEISEWTATHWDIWEPRLEQSIGLIDEIGGGLRDDEAFTGNRAVSGIFDDVVGFARTDWCINIQKYVVSVVGICHIDDTNELSSIGKSLNLLEKSGVFSATLFAF